ncbi:MAG: polyphosphate polymerase domain-containing protein [Clostridiaceae bacterium]|jgi:hypothetical protein|nr:polyphosphate polymerase domain-containing protein [Clostridiaceae bacterium]
MTGTLRYELKFHIPPFNAAILEKKLQYIIPYDENGTDGVYNVKSLYFDDFYDQALSGKMDGTFKLPKFRVRIYNDCLEFKKLERKLKRGDIVSKKSILINDDEYFRFIECSRSFSHEFPELQARPLKPRVIISYRRKAFVYKPGNVRITIDSDIKTSINQNPCLYRPACFINLPAPENIVFEVKYTGMFPDHLRAVFQEAGIRQSISKYAMGRMAGIYR